MKKLLSLTLCALLLMALLPVSAEAPSTPSITIVVAGNLGDRSFYDSAKGGIDRLAADFNTVTNVIACQEDASRYESALREAANNSDIIAAVGWQFYDYLEDVAEDYPDKKFLFIDNALEEIPANVMCITYK